MVHKMETWDPDSKSSLLHDIENKRKTEIDYLNGSILRIARQNNVKVPLNELTYHCLKVQCKKH